MSRGIRVLLLASPRAFRRRYGTEIAAAAAADLRRGGGRSAVWTALAVATDIVGAGLAERLRPAPCHRPIPRVLPREESSMLDDLRHDLRQALRGLLRNPGFALLGLVVLAAGMAANATVFTLVERVFLSPPAHVVQADRLVGVDRLNQHGSSTSWSHPDALDYRRELTTLEVAAFDPTGSVVTARWATGAAPVRLRYVTDNYFDVLGIRPQAGRLFRAEDATAPRVAVLSHALWERAAGGAPGVVGTTVRLNGESFEVIGVAPHGFANAGPIGRAPDLWLPTTAQPLVTPSRSDWLQRSAGHQINWLQMVGRLGEGATPAAAAAELEAIRGRLQEAFPPDEGHESSGHGTRLLQPFHLSARAAESLRRMSGLLLAVALAVLAVAAANAAILLVARTMARRDELGVRLALGAGRGRIVRQLLCEGLLLAVAAAAAGWGLAFVTADLLGRALPLPLAVPLRPDAAVLAATLVLGSLVVVLFALGPALGSTRLDVARSLAGASARTAGDRSRLRDALVVLQVATSMVLVAGAALLGRSLLAAESVPLGLETEGRLYASVELRNHGYDAEEALRFYRAATAELAAVPDVLAVSTTQFRPFAGLWTGSVVVGDDADAPRLEPSLHAVGPGYFEVVGLPLLAGRAFALRDDGEAPPVAVVDRTFAETALAGRSSVGAVIRRGPGDEPITVVGVVENARYYELTGEPMPHVYFPVGQASQGRESLVMRTTGDSAVLRAAVTAALHRVDPEVAVTEMEMAAEALERAYAPYRVAAVAVAAFGGLALLLAAVGLYGVVAHRVQSRRRAIGIRMALGATRERVARGVVVGSLALVAVGSVLGLAAAVASARLVESFLFGVEPHDPTSFALALALLLAVGALGGLAPAWRAAGVDPATTLRDE